jgi:hypothetical protein
LTGTEAIELYSEQRLREFDEAEADLAAVLNRDRADTQIAVPPAPTLGFVAQGEMPGLAPASPT